MEGPGSGQAGSGFETGIHRRFHVYVGRFHIKSYGGGQTFDIVRKRLITARVSSSLYDLGTNYEVRSQNKTCIASKRGVNIMEPDFISKGGNETTVLKQITIT
ncbi:hypothetical protein AVEN_222728-1 [Araneus ventricosus]|uniref:Uncharacterized protein n=1 Tax=Araneus ventricosus TaxID=182803 RepID=A0A4Y2AZG4_ARAVE|nr:hypothetical protein AVEN_222728-1 [Araneus ventricosus]